MRGLMFDVGNWNADVPVLGFRHCEVVLAAHVVPPAFAITTNCVVLTPLMLVWLKMLKASAISWTLRRSLTGMFFVTRGSSETVRGRLKVSRPRPGTRSVKRLESLFRSELSWADCAVKIPLSSQPPRKARGSAENPWA